LTVRGNLGVALAAFAMAAAGSKPLSAAPPAKTQAEINHLLDLLAVAPDEEVATALELRVHDLWRHAASPAAVILLEHGVVEIQNNSSEAATQDLDAALALEPDYIEAFNDRAAARLLGGDYDGAARDVAEALRREPREFAALQTLSRVAEARHEWPAALEAWQKVLAIDPKTRDGQSRLNLLRRNAEGEPT
jgi:tetratricopeptide (TPR) repeat protein